MSNSTPKIDLEKLAIETQALCDDASMDHAYCGQLPLMAGGGEGAWIHLSLDGSDDENTRRVELLKYRLQTLVKFHRAKGGFGRGVVRFRKAEGGLQGQFKFISSPKDLFDFIRENAHEHA